jgi:hypothetical protein
VAKKDRKPAKRSGTSDDEIEARRAAAYDDARARMAASDEARKKLSTAEREAAIEAGVRARFAAAEARGHQPSAGIPADADAETLALVEQVREAFRSGWKAGAGEVPDNIVWRIASYIEASRRPPTVDPLLSLKDDLAELRRLAVSVRKVAKRMQARPEWGLLASDDQAAGAMVVRADVEDLLRAASSPTFAERHRPPPRSAAWHVRAHWLADEVKEAAEVVGRRFTVGTQALPSSCMVIISALLAIIEPDTPRPPEQIVDALRSTRSRRKKSGF